MMLSANTQAANASVMTLAFEHLPTPVLLYDRNLTITGANQAAGDLLGQAADDMVGQQCRDVFHCKSCEPLCGINAGLNVDRSAPLPVHQHQSDGKRRLVVVRTTQLHDDDGNLEGVMATVDSAAPGYIARQLEIVAESPRMKDVLRFVRRIAVSQAPTVLLDGENGVGKDVMARALHYESPRQSGPFIAINCAAIPETLLESELFGYEKGAFTDAKQQKRGLFELADNGTLFLDEIGEVPLKLQAKLLRVIEDQTFRRLGGVTDIKVNVRVVAATNRNLREAVEQGLFRQDLYYRLNVLQVTIPALRERTEDIIPLATTFIRQLQSRYAASVRGLSPQAVRALLAHDWPGNVRELRNAIERAMVLEESDQITLDSLPPAILNREPVGSVSLQTSSDMSLEGNERALLASALEQCGGNQVHAAKMLGIGRDALRYKMKKYNLR
jgi:PAS domain S-box-containing protein